MLPVGILRCEMWVIGLNGELNWGGVHRFQDPNDVFRGTFVGTATTSPSLGIYGSLSYSVEVLNINVGGAQWLPRFPTLVDALVDVGNVLWNDIFHLP